MNTYIVDDKNMNSYQSLMKFIYVAIEIKPETSAFKTGKFLNLDFKSICSVTIF